VGSWNRLGTAAVGALVALSVPRGEAAARDTFSAPTGWTQTLKPCDHPEAEATLTLNAPTYWSVTLQNLPGVMPFTQVSLSEPFGE